MSSSPMFKRPTVGRSMPSTADTRALPITANWTSCCGVNRETMADAGFALFLMPRQRSVERILPSDENDARISRGLEKSDRGGDRDRRAMIAPHRIDGQRDGHDV